MPKRPSRHGWSFLVLMTLLPGCAPKGGGEAPVVVSPGPLAAEKTIPPPRPSAAAADPSDGNDALEVLVAVDSDGRWRAQYPEGQRVRLTARPAAGGEGANGDPLVVPIGRAVKFTVKAGKDAARFSVDRFPVALEVPAGEVRSVSVVPRREGTYECRSGPIAIGRVVVVPATEFHDYLAGLFEGDRPPDRPGQDRAAEGRVLFLRLQCIVCHSGQPDAKGPVLEDLFGTKRKVHLAQPGEKLKTEVITVDEAYLLESLADPLARVVEGWKPVMPESYHQQTTAEERQALVEFIKQLKRGHAPRRNEPAAPLAGAAKMAGPAVAPAPREKPRE